MENMNDQTKNEINEIISQDLATKTIAKAFEKGGEFAEIFGEERSTVSGFFEDGKVEEFSSGSAKGVGIRVISGNSTGFAHTSDLSEQGLFAAAQAAAQASKNSNPSSINEIALTPKQHPRPNEVTIDPDSVSKSQKAELLEAADEAARLSGSEIVQVSASYGDKRRAILVANSEGVFTRDNQVRTFFAVSCVAKGDSGMHTGRETIGHTIGFELFDQYEVADVAKKAAKRALTKLNARPAPSGAMPVVVGAGGGGVLFHEACGHGLEADAIEKSASTFTGKLGQKVASPLITLVDDGQVSGEWGCYAIDDEGHPAQHNVLIKDGELVDYMWDGLRAKNEGRKSSGNGRRQSYEYLPMVRMTNTYIEAGDTDPAAIIADTPNGVFVSQLGGGQVNPASGDFVFGMTEAYLIENGLPIEK